MDPVLIVALVSISAGLVSSLLGWAEGGDAFDPRKLFCALARGGIGGLVVGYMFLQKHASLAYVDYMLLFLSAVGIDLGLNKAVKVAKNK